MSIISNKAFSYLNDTKARIGVKELTLNSQRIMNVHKETFEEFKIFFENHRYQAKYILELDFVTFDIDFDFLMEILDNCIQLRNLSCDQPPKQITGWTYDNLVGLAMDKADSSYIFPKRLQKLTLQSREKKFTIDFNLLPCLENLEVHVDELILKGCRTTKLKKLLHTEHPNDDQNQEPNAVLSIDGPLEFLETSYCEMVDPKYYDDLFSSAYLSIITVHNLDFDRMFPIKSLKALAVKKFRSTKEVNLSHFFPFLEYFCFIYSNLKIYSEHVLKILDVTRYSKYITEIKSKKFILEELYQDEDGIVFDFTNYDSVVFEYFQRFRDERRAPFLFKRGSNVKIRELAINDFEREQFWLPAHGYLKSYDGQKFDQFYFSPEEMNSITLYIGKRNFKKINYMGNEISVDEDLIAEMNGEIFIQKVVNRTITNDFKCSKNSTFEFFNCLIKKTSGFENSRFVNCTFMIPIEESLFTKDCDFFWAANCDFRFGVDNFYRMMNEVDIFDSLIRKKQIMTLKFQGFGDFFLGNVKAEKNCFIDSPHRHNILRITY